MAMSNRQKENALWAGLFLFIGTLLVIDIIAMIRGP